MKVDENRNAAASLIIGVLILAISYAVLRYHLAGPVPWKDFPFFILNKGFSLAAFVLIACNFGFGPLRNVGVPVPDSWLAVVPCQTQPRVTNQASLKLSMCLIWHAGNPPNFSR